VIETIVSRAGNEQIMCDASAEWESSSKGDSQMRDFSFSLHDEFPFAAKGGNYVDPDYDRLFRENPDNYGYEARIPTPRHARER
jgi:hypothetical protein